MIERLRKANPEYVFVGNSMLESRIDPAYLEELLDGRECALLSDRNSATAVWYVFLKHVLIPSKVKPKRVFIFFRDEILTGPGMGLHPIQIDKVLRLIRFDDPILDRVLEGMPVSWKEKVHHYLSCIYPVQSRREAVEDLMKTIASHGWIDRRRRIDTLQDRVNRLYSLDHLRSEKTVVLASPSEEKSLDFDHWLPKSFLPHFIAMSREHGFELCFVRLKRRPDQGTTQVKQSEELLRYMEKLEAYLDQEGCRFVDFTSDPTIDLSWYSRGDHISGRFKKQYTRKFFERLKEVFE
jgi:hypothetical protein